MSRGNELLSSGVRSVAQIGCGGMGSQVAAHLLFAYPGVLKAVIEVTPEAAEAAKGKVLFFLQMGFRLSQDQAQALVDAVIFTTEYSVLAEVRPDLVIEAGWENLAKKLEMYALVRRYAPLAIICPTSSFMTPEMLTDGIERPDLFINVHPFFGAPFVREFIPGNATDLRIARIVANFFRSGGVTPIWCPSQVDGRPAIGFLGNFDLIMTCREWARLIDGVDGVQLTPAQADFVTHQANRSAPGWLMNMIGGTVLVEEGFRLLGEHEQGITGSAIVSAMADAVRGGNSTPWEVPNRGTSVEIDASARALATNNMIAAFLWASGLAIDRKLSTNASHDLGLLCTNVFQCSTHLQVLDAAVRLHGKEGTRDLVHLWVERRGYVQCDWIDEVTKETVVPVLLTPRPAVNVDHQGDCVIATFARPMLGPDEISAMRETLLAQRGKGLPLIITTDGLLTGTGADAKRFTGDKLDPAELERVIANLNGLQIEVHTFDAPIIGAARGALLGGFLELFTLFDAIIAAEGTQFGQPEVQLGIFPGAGAAASLLRRVRPEDRLLVGEWVRGGNPFPAEVAVEKGVATQVVHPSVLIETAIACALEHARSGTRNRLKTAPLGDTPPDWAANFVPVGRSMGTDRVNLDVLNHAFRFSWAEALSYTAERFVEVVPTEAAQEGLTAFFSKPKRQPVFPDAIQAAA